MAAFPQKGETPFRIFPPRISETLSRKSCPDRFGKIFLRFQVCPRKIPGQTAYSWPRISF